MEAELPPASHAPPHEQSTSDYGSMHSTEQTHSHESHGLWEPQRPHTADTHSTVDSAIGIAITKTEPESDSITSTNLWAPISTTQQSPPSSFAMDASNHQQPQFHDTFEHQPAHPTGTETVDHQAPFQFGQPTETVGHQPVQFGQAVESVSDGPVQFGQAVTTANDEPVYYEQVMKSVDSEHAPFEQVTKPVDPEPIQFEQFAKPVDYEPVQFEQIVKSVDGEPGQFEQHNVWGQSAFAPEDHGMATEEDLKAQSREPSEQPAVFAPNSHIIGNIEVDSAYDTDADSTFFDTRSETTSLSSSVTNYTFENGRRYHGYKGGRYMIPNDEMEMDREDMKHHISLLMLEGRLHLAPIPRRPQKILDIGTGTGIWAMQIADIYPSAEVIATDLSPIQPTWVSPNLKFEIDDAEAEWLYGDDVFDLVHLRYMAHAIRNWPKVYEQAYRAIKPGGWIEVVDWHFIPSSYDNSLPANSQFQEFYNYIAEAAAKVGLDMGVASKLRGMTIDAGYVNVREEVFDLPMGPWPKDPRLKEIGMFQQIQFTEGLSGIAMGLLTRVLGWSTARVEVFLVGVRNELRDRGVHSFWKMHVVSGQKPAIRYAEPHHDDEPLHEYHMQI